MRVRFPLPAPGLSARHAGLFWGLAAALTGSASAWAAPILEIHAAAARVTIIPEARPDIAISVSHVEPSLPLRVRKLGDRVTVTGDIAHRVHGCPTLPGGKRGVAVWGRGTIPLERLPVIVIRMPLDARLMVKDGVFGEIGHSASVDLTNEGCGDWTIADAQGTLRVNQTGPSVIRAGAAASSDLSAVGSGVIFTGSMRGGVKAVSSGAGRITVASIAGPLDARVAGSGSILVAAGTVSDMTVFIAGSGGVKLLGTTRTLNAQIAGPGEVSATRVTGRVTKQIFGAGRLSIGH